MAHTRPTPAEILRTQLEIKRRTLPIFLRPQLGDLLAMIDDWVQSVETRLAGLGARVDRGDKMPSAAALELLNQPLEGQHA